jgi:hypothetical protein
MNQGAYRIDPAFFDVTSLQQAFEKIKPEDWKPVIDDGSYVEGDSWRGVNLITAGKKTAAYSRFPHLDGIQSKFQCGIANMMFYSLVPGGKIHPHRDFVGAVGLGGLRLHLPIVTNPGVNFVVSNKKVVLRPGELWALDTSYEHAVENAGGEDRVHLVLDILVNDWVRSLIPKPNHHYYLHQAKLWALAAQKMARVALFEPKRIAGNLNVLKKAFRQYVFKEPANHES